MWKTLIFTMTMVLFASTPVLSGGITGSTTRNTSESQQKDFQNRMNNQQCRDSGVPQWMLDKARDKISGSNLILKGTDKALRGMEWSADQQRKLGGVPPTGSTVK